MIASVVIMGFTVIMYCVVLQHNLASLDEWTQWERSDCSRVHRQTGKSIACLQKLKGCCLVWILSTKATYQLWP